MFGMGLGFTIVARTMPAMIPILAGLLLLLISNIETENGDLLITENDDELII
jgi:hypothetical protein